MDIQGKGFEFMDSLLPPVDSNSISSLKRERKVKYFFIENIIYIYNPLFYNK